MRKLVKIIKDHKWAIFLAVLVGIIIAYPQAYFRYDNQDLYKGQGIETLTSSPRAYLVQEVRDGHLSMGSLWFKDGKNDPYIFQPLSSIIVALYCV